MRLTRLAVPTAIALMFSAVLASGPAGAVDASGVEFVTQISIPNSTHLEFMTRTVGGQPHVFALQGSRDTSLTGGWDTPAGGLNIIDITNPDSPVFVTNVPCKTDNLDIATTYFPNPLTRPVVNGITYDTIFSLASNNQGTGCLVTPRGGGTPIRGNAVQFAGIRAGAELVPGTTALDFLGGRVQGCPALPLPCGNSPAYPVDPSGARFTTWNTKFAHTVVAHPTLPVVYASNQELGTRNPTVEVIDLNGIVLSDDNWHPVVRSVGILPPSSGPHDITFSPDGKRAYVSSITTSAVLDTTNPIAPGFISTLVAPGLKIHHEGVLHPNGRHLLVVDEFVSTSSGGTPQCPGGGVHVMDLGAPSPVDGTNLLERAPVQAGVFLIPDASTVGLDQVDPNNPNGAPTALLRAPCTAHEYTIAADGSWTPMAWFGAGIRILDLSDLNAAAATPAPRPVVVREVGHYKTPTSSVWAAKVRPEFPHHVFVSDEFEGFQVYRVDPDILP